MKFREVTHKADFCVVGGGLAGMCAAIAAARSGARVVIMQDRPVFGGNASSEIRMWICGGACDDNRETGILEEIALENMYRNPSRNFSIWDSILYEKVKTEPNIEVLLNCTCNEAQMTGNRIKNVRGWQLTTQTYHKVEADLFADCSGDSVLAPLTGAEFRTGQESKEEYGEEWAPEQEQPGTMGNSCLIQARETPSPCKYIPPKWAYKYTEEDLHGIKPDLNYAGENFWWMELGGNQDTIHDAEEIRDELLKVAFGIWDYVKTHDECNAQNWDLDWVGFLPGKRESRRYVGDYVLLQKDACEEIHFDDAVAFGGWSLDDHPSEGMKAMKKKHRETKTRAPYEIPYRCLYSKNIENLFFAGRNISASHIALSSTRVMATCAVMGQAVGTAAAIAAKYNLTPRGVYKQKIRELQQLIMDNDGFIPNIAKEINELTKKAELIGDGENIEALRSGIERSSKNNNNAWLTYVGAEAVYTFKENTFVNGMRFVFDSDLERSSVDGDWYEKNMTTTCNLRLNRHLAEIPKTMVKDFDIWVMNEQGKWEKTAEIRGNYQRLVKFKLDKTIKAVKFNITGTHGNTNVKVFSWELF